VKEVSDVVEFNFEMMKLIPEARFYYLHFYTKLGTLIGDEP